MEVLGIGASELAFIILIAIIVMGPGQMKQAGKTIGHWLNKATHSELWKIVRDTSNELSNLPRKLMREANIETWEAEQGLKHTIDPRPNKPAASPTPQEQKPTSFRGPTSQKTVGRIPSSNKKKKDATTPND